MLFRVSFADPKINEENEKFEWVFLEDVSAMDTVTDTMAVLEQLMK